MAEGRVAFLGNTNDAVDFFQNMNHPCPYNFNPADHYIHVLAVTPGYEAESRSEIEKICDSFDASDFGQTVWHLYNYFFIIIGRYIPKYSGITNNRPAKLYSFFKIFLDRLFGTAVYCRVWF